MVTDALLDLLAGLWAGFLALVPAPPSMDWIDDPVIMSVASDVGAMGAWLPLTAIGMVVAALLASWLAAGGTIIVRMLVSLFTGGGGSVSAK